MGLDERVANWMSNVRWYAAQWFPPEKARPRKRWLSDEAWHIVKQIAPTRRRRLGAQVASKKFIRQAVLDFWCVQRQRLRGLAAPGLFAGDRCRGQRIESAGFLLKQTAIEDAQLEAKLVRLQEASRAIFRRDRVAFRKRRLTRRRRQLRGDTPRISSPPRGYCLECHPSKEEPSVMRMARC